MPQRPLAELIRFRRLVNGKLSDSDLVVCLADDELELLAERPDLAARNRCETQHIAPRLVLFLPTFDGTAGLGVGLSFGTIDRHVGD